MSLALSGHSLNTLDYGASEPAAIPTPTVSQEAHSLEAVGHSVQEISVVLSIPTAQVASSLEIHTASAAPSTEGLNIHA